MIFEHRSYRDVLKAVLAGRKAKNPSYSLRAFAGALGFSSSQLSEAMNGRANFSPHSLRKIAGDLKFNLRETEYFLTLGDYEHARDHETRAHFIKKLERLNPSKIAFHDLTLDHYKQISEWHHSAILELVYVNNFDMSAKNIARSLGINQQESELALERLLRLGLIVKNSEGDYSRSEPALQIRSTEKNEAMQSFYRQMLEKASKALDSQTPSKRWSGYETIPIAKEALPEIRNACDAFFDEVLRISDQYPTKTEVYHLLTHFFSLTENSK